MGNVVLVVLKSLVLKVGLSVRKVQAREIKNLRFELVAYEILR